MRSRVCPLCGVLQRHELDAGFGCASCERRAASSRRTLAEVVDQTPFDPQLARLLEQKNTRPGD